MKYLKFLVTALLGFGLASLGFDFNSGVFWMVIFAYIIGLSLGFAEGYLKK